MSSAAPPPPPPDSEPDPTLEQPGLNAPPPSYSGPPAGSPPPAAPPPPTYDAPPPGYAAPEEPSGYAAPPPDYSAAPTPQYSAPSSSGSGMSSMSGDQVKRAFQSANPLDLAILATGVLTFIFSLFPYYTVDLGELGGSGTAWHGFWGWFAVLLVLVACGILVAALVGVSLPIPLRLTVLALFGVALLCVLLAGLTWPGAGGASALGIDVGDVTGHGIGYYLSLITIVIGTALAGLRLTATDRPA